jgi:hypothetical protein
LWVREHLQILHRKTDSRFNINKLETRGAGLENGRRERHDRIRLPANLYRGDQSERNDIDKCGFSHHHLDRYHGKFALRPSCQSHDDVSANIKDTGAVRGLMQFVNEQSAFAGGDDSRTPLVYNIVMALILAEQIKVTG